MQKTVLITGCSGQLGHQLSLDLSNHFNIISTYKNHNNKKHKLDVTNNLDFEYIFSIYNPDIIINCAASTDVDYCENNHKISHKVNVLGLNKLINFSNFNAKIIHISSDLVFNGFKPPYKETDPTYPVNYYGKSKLESENILIGSNRNYTIFRVSMLFNNNNHNNFFTWVVNNLSNRKKIKVATDLSSNPTWISAFSEILIKSIYLDISGVYHYGSDNSISRYEFAKLIARKFNISDKFIIPVNSKEINFVATRPKNTTLVCKKISDDIDISLYSVDYILKLIKKIQ